MVGILNAEIGSHFANVGWARTTIAAAQNQYEKRKDGNQSYKNRTMDLTHGGGRFSVRDAAVGDGPPHQLKGCTHWQECYDAITGGSIRVTGKSL
ncbi:MAG: hypothetical protein WCA20_27330 [Candidatus Sulfotelmatobacter sp.]